MKVLFGSTGTSAEKFHGIGLQFAQFLFLYHLVMTNIAMENDPFIDDLTYYNQMVMILLVHRACSMLKLIVHQHAVTCRSL